MLETYINQIPLSITTQALLLGLAVGVISYQLLKKKSKLPPGPWALPLLGNLLSLKSPKPIYRILAEWRLKYGPVVTMYFGPMPCVTLNTADVVIEAYVKKAADFAGRIHSYSFEKFSEGYKDIVLADFSTAWKIQRKLANQGLRQCLSGNRLENKVFESASKVVKILKDNNGEIIDVKKYISLLVFNVLHGVCFNKSFDIDDKWFVQLMNNFEETNNEFGNGVWEDIIPPLRKFPTKRFTRIMKKMNEFLSFIKEECNAHKENFSADNLRDFTDFMIHARNEAAFEDPEIMSIVTDGHIVQTISDIFSAGADTTRQTLTWTIFLLVKHPEIQKKLHAELDQVLAVGQAPTLDDRERLPYTEAVLHESMRICPVVPIGVPHATRCDTTIGEYQLPKDTMVLVNHWALHHDPDVWDEPHVFKPERFLDEDGKLKQKPMSWLPFSAGRRNCLGESIAKPAMHLILAILMRNFEFILSQGKTLNMKPKGSMVFQAPNNELMAVERK